MKISIIIPTYNSGKTLARCLESIINQTFSHKEIILIDGCSKDNTLEIVAEYAGKYDFVHWISEKDQGIYDAMNKGIKKSTGDWVYFLGSDDYLINSLVLNQMAEIISGTSASCVYGNVIYGDSGKIHAGEFERMRLFRKNICHQSMFFKRNLFSELGYLDNNFRILGDLDFNLRLFFSNHDIKYTHLVIAYFNIGGLSSSLIFSQEHERKAIFMKAKRNFKLVHWIEYTYYFAKSRFYKYLLRMD